MAREIPGYRFDPNTNRYYKATDQRSSTPKINPEELTRALYEWKDGQFNLVQNRMRPTLEFGPALNNSPRGRPTPSLKMSLYQHRASLWVEFSIEYIAVVSSGQKQNLGRGGMPWT